MEIIYQDYRLRLMRSRSSPTELFALIGHYLASPRVRHECGGYALNDGPHYRWLIAQKQGEAMAAGLLSFELRKGSLVLHHGYLDPAHRGHGIFRAMLRLVLGFADSKSLPVHAQVTVASIPYLQKLGFEATGNRGQWHKLIRTARDHGRSIRGQQTAGGSQISISKIKQSTAQETNTHPEQHTDATS